MQGSRTQGGARLWARKAALIAGLSALLACSPKAPELLVHSANGEVRIAVEIVDTPEGRALGLMYRRDLAETAGMLFAFPDVAPRSFWMKNTPLPLDMVFIGPDWKVVGIVANTKPFTLNPLGVEEPSKYVLEVNAGFCARHGLAVGEVLEPSAIHTTPK